MTLQSSGPISLGDVQGEFTGSNPISLGEYLGGGQYVTNGTSGINGYIPSSTTISLSHFYGTAKSQFTVLSSSTVDEFWGITYDSTNSCFIVVGNTGAGGSTKKALIVKYDLEFNLVWQKTLSSTDPLGFECVCVDSSGNIYVGGRRSISSFPHALFAKYNSSGTLQWQKEDPTDIGEVTSIKWYDDNTIYVVGKSGKNASSWDLDVSLYNSSGTRAWSRQLVTSEWDEASDVGLDSSGNAYVCGFYDKGSSLYTGVFVKYNSSGTQQWQRKIGDNSGNRIVFRGIATTSSGTSYIVGESNVGDVGSNDLLLCKYNSSGTLQWQKMLGGSGSEAGRRVVLDSSENVYVTGYTESAGAGSGDMLVAKYDSSGTLQWQKVFGYTGLDALFRSDICFVNGYLVAVMGLVDTNSSDNGAVIKFPALYGCKNGTFGTSPLLLTVSSSSLTSATSTAVEATGTLTQNTTANTLSTSTHTAATSTLTQNTYTIN